jgi:hypothetical protein
MLLISGNDKLVVEMFSNDIKPTPNLVNIAKIVRFEVSTAVTMMIIIFWEMIIIAKIVK